MLRSITAIIASLRRFIERREGSVAVIFALCAIPIFIAAGMAVDIGRAYAVKVRLGAALDAAALAVGSEGSQTAAQLTTDLNNYFKANYPTTMFGTNVSATPVPANADLTAATVNYQAQATVPMTLMRLVGIDNITITVTAQTKKTTGLEIAVVLDNTGSMLCGASDGAPSYSNPPCGTGVVASDTTCTNASNGSCICTLINAATEFINTLTSAINASQQLYISIVPYVTTVNVGSTFCTSSTSCSNIASTSGNFTDLRGNMLLVTPIIGTTTSGSTTISSVSVYSGQSSSYVSGTAAIQTGMYIYGHGIPSGATVSTVSSTSIVISSAATLTFTGNSLAVGPASGNISNACVDPTTYTGAKATLSKTSTTVTFTTGTTTNNVVAGMAVSGTGIASGTTVATVVSATQITLSADPTANETPAETLTFSLTGKTTSGNTTVSTLDGSTTSLNSIVVGMPVTGTTAQFAAGTGTLTISNAATKPSNFSSATGTCCNTTLVAFTPLTYDSTYETASPAGSSTTQNWGGCVIEPTSSGENASGTGVLAVSGNPDTSEPVSGTNWYPYYWVKDSTNSWPTVKAQDTATETQSATANDWLSEDGPNQDCPAPMLPLTDVTTTTGKTTVLNTISSMWPRDAGGTQVHIGMIWGWRVLSPNGPLTPNNGHPLSYSTASTTGWKKAIVLMTDGTEEWPSADNMTGLGQIADGKIGTTSDTTAVTNLNTRLASVCSNLAADGNYIIYTIGLGSDGASNTQLQNCATTSNGGFFEAATPTNLQKVFNDIAKSLIALRLSE